MSSLFQALRNYKVRPPPPKQKFEEKRNIFLTHMNDEQKKQHPQKLSSQSSQSRSLIKKQKVKKIIGKARLDSPEYGRFTFYLIKWKSQSWKYSTWQHPQHLQNVIGKIIPFNINIKDKPLPYFDTKYKEAEPNYKSVLEEFIENFLEAKRTQKQNLSSVKPEEYNIDQESSYWSDQRTRSNKKQKIKKIKKSKKSKKIKRRFKECRDLKTTIVERAKEMKTKQETNDYQIGYHNRKNKQDRDHSKNNKKRKHKPRKEKNDNNHSFVDAAIRQCFQLRIRNNSANKNDQKKWEKQLQLGEVLSSSAFSGDSASERSGMIKKQRIEKDIFEEDSFQGLVYFSEADDKEDSETKQEIKSEPTNEKSKDTEYCENINEEYEPEPGEMVLNNQGLIYSKFVENEEGELTDVKYTYMG